MRLSSLLSLLNLRQRVAFIYRYLTGKQKPSSLEVSVASEESNKALRTKRLYTPPALDFLTLLYCAKNLPLDPNTTKIIKQTYYDFTEGILTGTISSSDLRGYLGGKPIAELPEGHYERMEISPLLQGGAYDKQSGKFAIDEDGRIYISA